MVPRRYEPGAPEIPKGLRRCFESGHPGAVTAQGDVRILDGTLTGFFCSVRCPGNPHRPAADPVLVQPHAPAPTAALAAQRNDLLAALATAVFIPYAVPEGRTEALTRKLAAAGKPVVTVDSPSNANLLTLGARRHPACERQAGLG